MTAHDTKVVSSVVNCSVTINCIMKSNCIMKNSVHLLQQCARFAQSMVYMVVLASIGYSEYGSQNLSRPVQWTISQPLYVKEKGWCGLWAGGIIIIINQHIILSTDGWQLIWSKLDEMDVNNTWFQQDGATCHTAEATMNILHEIGRCLTNVLNY